jgi:tetratricopeptide (TPR) repeat protein
VRHFCRLPFAVVALVALTRPVWADPPRAVAPAAEQRTEAEARFDEGAAAYRAGHYANAVEHFLAADALSPSAALSFNVARAYEKLDETAKALRHYRDFLRRAPNAPNARDVKSRVATLETRLLQRGLQQVTVLSEPEAELAIDGLSLGRTPWTGELRPGPHRVVLSRAGYAAQSRDFELSGEHAMDVVVRLGPAGSPNATPVAQPSVASPMPRAPVPAGPKNDRTPRSEGLDPWPWVTVGAGGVALVSAGVLELFRQSAEKEARQATNQLAYADRLESMQSRQTAARVLFGVGAGLVVIGTTLVIVDLGTRDERKLVAVTCAPDACLGRVEVALP